MISEVRIVPGVFKEKQDLIRRMEKSWNGTHVLGEFVWPAQRAGRKFGRERLCRIGRHCVQILITNGGTAVHRRGWKERPSRFWRARVCAVVTQLDAMVNNRCYWCRLSAGWRFCEIEKVIALAFDPGDRRRFSSNENVLFAEKA